MLICLTFSHEIHFMDVWTTDAHVMTQMYIKLICLIIELTNNNHTCVFKIMVDLRLISISSKKLELRQH